MPTLHTQASFPLGRGRGSSPPAAGMPLSTMSLSTIAARPPPPPLQVWHLPGREKNWALLPLSSLPTAARPRRLQCGGGEGAVLVFYSFFPCTKVRARRPGWGQRGGLPFSMAPQDGTSRMRPPSCPRGRTVVCAV